MTRFTDAIVKKDVKLATKIAKGYDIRANFERLVFNFQHRGKKSYFEQPINDDNKSTPAHLIATNFYGESLTPLIKALAKHKVNFNLLNAENDTPAAVAIRLNNLQFIVDARNLATLHKPDLKLTGGRYTVLQLYIMGNAYDCQDFSGTQAINKLCDLGADVDQAPDPKVVQADIPGNALHYAVMYMHSYSEYILEAFKEVVRHTKDINAILIKDGRRHTALSLAIEAKKDDFVKVLLLHGANPYVYGPPTYFAEGDSTHGLTDEILKLSPTQVLTSEETLLAETIALNAGIAIDRYKRLQRPYLPADGWCDWLVKNRSTGMYITWTHNSLDTTAKLKVAYMQKVPGSDTYRDDPNRLPVTWSFAPDNALFVDPDTNPTHKVHDVKMQIT